MLNDHRHRASAAAAEHEEGPSDSAEFRDIHALTPPSHPSRGRRRELWEGGSHRSSSLSIGSDAASEGFTTMSREFNAMVVAGSTMPNDGGNGGNVDDGPQNQLARIGEDELEETNPLAIVPDNNPFPSPRRPPPEIDSAASSSADEVRVHLVKKEEVESKISAWQTAEVAKINNRFKREEAIINGWESEQVEKATARLKKIEGNGEDAERCGKSAPEGGGEAGVGGGQEGNQDGSILAEFLAVAVDAAKSAGEVIRKGFYQTKHVEHKGQVDLVTETDKACEELIFNHLKKHYPDHKFIGEETSAAFGTAELTDEPTWIVDPLDGTTNFVHGFPFVCVSIGLAIGKVPTVGVVYNPIIGELFTGVRGQGAFLNGNPIKASSQSELLKALLVTEVGTKRDKSTVDATTNRINNLLFKVRSLRMCGSLALNLCGIACGRLDLCYEIGFGGPWDVAAGAVIVHEAGGLVFDPSGGDFDLMSCRVAASNCHLKDAFILVLTETD
ncbi:unnamed protein product [Musa acuminata subsp. burmannicoides]